MEITFKPDFTISERSLIDMHSLLNVLNIIIHELLMIEDITGECSEIDDLIEENSNIGVMLSDPAEAQTQISNVEEFIEKIENSLEKVSKSFNLENNDYFIKSTNNLQSIFAVLRVRAAEITARSQNPDAWVSHPISLLQENFKQVFQAIATNSHGEYGIVYNIAEQRDNDYLVHLSISGFENPVITMPSMFQDVMRDLLANARKYTAPGGRIISGLHSSEKELVFVVEDNGYGIIPEEIERVVAFGERGSNTSHLTTRGGGFGLTKAYYVTSRFSGRMWIESSGINGQGTRIKIVIPLIA